MSNQKLANVAGLFAILGVVGVLFLIYFARAENLERLYRRAIFEKTEFLEFTYGFGFVQESYWSGWIEHTPSSMREKLESGVWSVSGYFHEQKEYGLGNDYHQGIKAYQERYPDIDAEDLIFLSMQRDRLSRGEVRGVTTEAMTESFVFAWGHF